MLLFLELDFAIIKPRIYSNSLLAGIDLYNSIALLLSEIVGSGAINE